MLPATATNNPLAGASSPRFTNGSRHALESGGDTVDDRAPVGVTGHEVDGAGVDHLDRERRGGEVVVVRLADARQVLRLDLAFERSSAFGDALEQDGRTGSQVDGEVGQRQARAQLLEQRPVQLELVATQVQ